MLDLSSVVLTPRHASPPHGILFDQDMEPMVNLVTHSIKRRIDWQEREPTGTKKVMTNTLCIQEAGVKRWFSARLMTQINQNHTLGPGAQQ